MTSGPNAPKALLAAAGLRCTRSRVAILGALSEAGEPLNQDQITARLGSQAPNKVTVYRVLESLCEAGLVHRAFIRDRTCYYETAEHCSEHQCHPHFTCLGCGQTHCLTDMRLPAPVRSFRGYAIHRQRVQFEGLCPQCSP